VLAHWRDAELAAGRTMVLTRCVTMVLTAGRTTVLRHRRPSLAHWCNDELVMGPMAVLACWRDDVSRKAVLAHSLAPSGNGSTAVDILGPDRN
jgi:hypothetical protein